MTKRVLIIDDDEDLSEVAKVALESTAGWRVEVRCDGPSGLEAVLKDPPDAVLLDYMMPGMDGFTALKEIKNDPGARGVPVIVFTAKSDSGLIARLKQAGATGHVSKPFDPMTLAGTMEALLGWKNEK